MKIYASGADYLEAVLVLQKKKGMVRSVDLARHMGFSKPSISHAVGVLKNGGFLTVDEDGYLHLTEDGREVAEKIYDKRKDLFMNVPRSGSSHYTFRKSGCMPITIPKHEPIKKVYVEMVREIVESEAKNHEDVE